MPWRYALASAVGTSHLKADMPCQDRSDCCVLEVADGSEALVAVVSDGAGSAQFSEVGAELACRLFLEEITERLADDGSLGALDKNFAEAWLERFQTTVALRAEEDEAEPRDYACTFLAAILANDWAAFFQIGDGAIVVSSPDAPGEFDPVYWPQRGEYENQTTFLTQEAAKDTLQFDLVHQYVEEVALFTDGLQRMALHFQSESAHTPFFQAMFAPLRTESAGFSETLSSKLAAFLNSPLINERTDDDKTLVLASRKTVQPTPPVIETHDEQPNVESDL